MTNISCLNSGKINETAEYFINFEDGNSTQINPRGFTIPGMMGQVHVKKINIICCEIDKPLEIEFSLSNAKGLFFKTSSVVKKISKDVYKNH